ncbi:putative cytochrome P450 [Cercophora scortea]|uniref:Cytochrome P450 n=1 Tax=Cercophora scortea TaxID=314031 RepID=A0AAE0I4M9_9PEZI|nr:putative cytochrome P450 [Cercophora scortea]
MELFNVAVHQVQQLTEHCAESKLLLTAAVLAPLSIAFFIFTFVAPRNAPPSLWDPIPYVFNTIQFAFNNERFMVRVANILQNSRIAKFHLVSTPVFLVSGPENIQTLFARSHKVGNETIFLENVFPALYRMSKDEKQRFADDKSGRGRQPAPGTEHMPAHQRYWHGYEHVHSEYLSRAQHQRPMAEQFQTFIAAALDKHFPPGLAAKPETVSVMDFCRRHVAEAAVKTLLGPRIFELFPDVLDAFWEFDSNICLITLALPKWLFPGPYRAQERFYTIIRKYLAATYTDDAFDSVAAEADQDGWNPKSGARVSRELVKWLKTSGFQDEVAVGALAMLMFAMTSNTIPIVMWMMIEITRDPSLLCAVRDEVAQAYISQPGKDAASRTLDLDKLSTMPFLQSVFAEVLRLHMNFNLMRNVNEPIAVEGFTLPRGSMLQAPMKVAHYDETVWGAPGHAAAQFWAERHIKYEETADADGSVRKVPVFAMAGRPSSFFPFGGGQQICPGRHLAKHEIFTVIALLVSKFEIEPLEWTNTDGSPSLRAARGDPRFSGIGAMPPDRDLKMRWTRIG